MMSLTGLVVIYYPVIVTWTLYYLAMSFSSKLPWASCDNAWNTEACYVRGTETNQTLSTGVTSRVLTYTTTRTNYYYNSTVDDSILKKTTASEEFWK